MIIVAFVVTRHVPDPIPPSATCADSTDCPRPKTCVNHACVDTALPSLLAAAQTSADALQQWLETIPTMFASWAANVGTLQSVAIAQGLSRVPDGQLVSLQAAMAAGVSMVSKYSAAYSSGYLIDISSLTPASNPGKIFTVSVRAPVATAQVNAVAGVFPPVAAALSNVTSAVSADAQARGVRPGASTQAAMDIVTQDAGFNATSQLARLVQAVNQTAAALSAHLLG